MCQNLKYFSQILITMKIIELQYRSHNYYLKRFILITNNESIANSLNI